MLRCAQLRLRVALTTHSWFSSWQTHFQLHPYSLTGFKSWLSYLLTPVMYTHRYTGHLAPGVLGPCVSADCRYTVKWSPWPGGQARVAQICCSFTRVAQFSAPTFPSLTLFNQKGDIGTGSPPLERSLPHPHPTTRHGFPSLTRGLTALGSAGGACGRSPCVLPTPLGTVQGLCGA